VSTISELKFLLNNSNVQLPTPPTSLVNAVDVISNTRDRKLIPIHRNMIRRNIALLFRFIRTNVNAIDKKHPGLLREDCFVREISRTLALLQTMYDFYGKVPVLTEEEMDKKKMTKKDIIQRLFYFSKNPLAPANKQDALSLLVFINMLCRYIESVLTKQQLK
jgi:hypothetical protein